MIKVAFFLEGQTEQIFIEKLLQQHIGYQGQIVKINLRGRPSFLGTKNRFKTRKSDNYYFLLVNVGSDEKVVSVIKENLKAMTGQSKFQAIFGIRDVYPEVQREDKNKLYISIRNQIPTDKVKIVLATMEIEAWFLADHNLFSQIDSRLTPGYIKKNLNHHNKPVDLVNDDPENRYDRPANIVKDIYNLVSFKYKKRKDDIHKITNKIDYDTLCLTTKDQGKIKAFHNFMDELDLVINKKK